MQFKNVKRLINPLIAGGKKWQYISINGDESKPRFYFSDIQWVIAVISCLLLFKLTKGITTIVMGYIMSAFAISVSLFMSLLVSIFDKFEKTNFEQYNKSEDEIVRLIQKKNFFKRFISITSYLVVLSILIIILCSGTMLFNLSEKDISYKSFTYIVSNIDIILTLKNIIVILYRICLNYFLLNYLFLTLFITGSAYEYYMSEMNKNKIEIQ